MATYDIRHMEFPTNNALPMTNQHDVASWSVTASGDNLLATATKAAESGKSHYITGVMAGYSAAAIKSLAIKDGAGTIATLYVHNSKDVSFAKPIKITAGNTASAELAASGTAAVLGSVTLTGYTI